MISNTLQIRYNLKGCRYLAQVLCYRLLAKDQGQTAGLNGTFHVIYIPVSFNNVLCHGIILVFKCHESLFNGFFHHHGHIPQAFIQFL